MQPVKAKEKYLKTWLWESSFDDQYGFKVWTHNRWPNMKYKIDRAYKIMKSNEPNFEPILTARINNPQEMDKIKYLTDKILNR